MSEAENDIRPIIKQIKEIGEVLEYTIKENKELKEKRDMDRWSKDHLKIKSLKEDNDVFALRIEGYEENRQKLEKKVEWLRKRLDLYEDKKIYYTPSDYIQEIISIACMQHSYSGEASFGKEARRIIEALRKSGYKIKSLKQKP